MVNTTLPSIVFVPLPPAGNQQLRNPMSSSITVLLTRYLLLWLTLLSAIAYFWPQGIFDPFVATRPGLGSMIAVTMLCLGSLIPADEGRKLLSQLPYVGFGTLVQCTVMPLAALLVVNIWELEEGYRLGVILVGCVPGAMASNVLTLAAGGNVSYSVSLTTLATLLSPITVPSLLVLLSGISGAEIPIDPGKMMFDLMWTVVIPVVGGFALARWNSRFESLAQSSGPIVANLVILWIIAVVVALSRERMESIPFTVLISLVVANLIGYAGGYGAAALVRLPETMRRALTLEVGMQNAGLGTFLAVSTFGTQFPEAAIPPAAYTFGCMLTGTVLVTYWRESQTRLERNPRP